MRPTGKWNSFAMERAESRREVCRHIVNNGDCFQVHLGATALSLSRSSVTIEKHVSGLTVYTVFHARPALIASCVPLLCLRHRKNDLG